MSVSCFKIVYTYNEKEAYVIAESFKEAEEIAENQLVTYNIKTITRLGDALIKRHTDEELCSEEFT
jgi:sulfur relay (sulfurtransferase) DsrF/TusC family protein